MTKKNTTPPFPFPFEYCTIERAAKLFNWETEDFKILHDMDAIQLCIHIDDLKDFDCGDICISEEIINNLCQSEPHGDSVKISLSWGQPNTMGQAYISVPNQHHEDYGDDIDKSDDDDIATIPIDSGDSKGYGFFAVDYSNLHDTGMLRFHPHADFISHKNPYSVSSISFIDEYTQEQLDESPLVYYVMRSDLEKIHEAIHTGQLLPNIYSNKKEINQHENKSRKPRVDKVQLQMVMALLSCLPDLKATLENASESSLPNDLNRFLRKKKLPEITISGKTFKQWMEDVDYNSKN